MLEVLTQNRVKCFYPHDYIIMSVCPLYHHTGNTITETSLKSYEDMNHFLSSFLEHVCSMFVCTHILTCMIVF